uniref:Uncharacterized protein n=1 Tax=Cacopsylla melanoneura TaxID=428564 RepID=A0A8D8QVJ1_9HEMI
MSMFNQDTQCSLERLYSILITALDYDEQNMLARKIQIINFLDNPALLGDKHYSSSGINELLLRLVYCLSNHKSKDFKCSYARPQKHLPCVDTYNYLSDISSDRIHAYYENLSWLYCEIYSSSKSSEYK